MLERQAVLQNTVVQTLGKIVSVILGWITVIAMTRYLGAAGFGSYTIMTAYLQFFGVAADLGLVLVSAQLLAERPAERQRIFANLLGFRLITSAAILILAPLVVLLLPYSPLVERGVFILTISFFFVALLQVLTGYFQQALEMWRAVAAELASRLVLLVVVIAAVWLERSLLFMVSGVALSSVVGFGVAAALAQSRVRLQLAFERELWRAIWQRSWPIALGVACNLIYLKADTLILSFVRPEAEVGVYGAMYRVLEVLITFPTMFAGLLLPLIAGAAAAERRQDIARTIQHGFDLLAYLAVPLAIGIWMTAPAIAALFGSEFVASGTRVLQLLGVATATIFIGTFLGHVIVALGRQRSVVWMYALTAAVSLVAYLVTIPRYGAVGAAAMTVAVESFIALLLYGYVRQRLKYRIAVLHLWPAVLGAVVMAGWLWLAYVLPLVLLVPTAIALYIGVLAGTGVLHRELLRDLFRLNTTLERVGE